MKQVFTSVTSAGRNSHRPYVNGKRVKLSKVLFLFCLAGFFLTSSSFKKELRQSIIENVALPKKPVPFKGRLSVSLGDGVTEGSGVGSHIGSFEYASVDDFSGFPFVSGSATITAANGDKIFTSFSGTLIPLANGMLSVNFENTITGGTGRFKGATGSFSSTGTANPAAFIASTTFKGTISY